jgi:hypothetical protein
VRAASSGSARVVICEPISDTLNAAQNLAKSRGIAFLAIVLSLTGYFLVTGKISARQVLLANGGWMVM